MKHSFKKLVIGSAAGLMLAVPSAFAQAKCTQQEGWSLLTGLPNDSLRFKQGDQTTSFCNPVGNWMVIKLNDGNKIYLGGVNNQMVTLSRLTKFELGFHANPQAWNSCDLDNSPNCKRPPRP